MCASIRSLVTPPPEAALGALQPPGQPQPAAGAPPLGPGVTASDVSRALGGVAVTIAAEHLMTAEARGVVCRDDGPEGTRFYRNFFQAAAAAAR